ncbi:MAG: hypothetical protein MMC33_001610 [Icmadophila ericetorum]|nr:hypothetical protein [Icmadophila ericetorum]
MAKTAYATTHGTNANMSPKVQRTASGRQRVPCVPVAAAVWTNPQFADHFKFSNEDSSILSLKANLPSLSLSPYQIPNTNYLSQSPLTPTSDGISNDSFTYSTPMSRVGSHVSGSLCGPFDMITIDSQRSNMSEKSPRDVQLPYRFQGSPDSATSNYFEGQQPHQRKHTGRTSGPTYAGSPTSDTCSQSTTLQPSFDQENKMSRTSSTESADSNKSRASRRLNDQIQAQNSRPIAPKQSIEETSVQRQASSSGHQMTRIKSEDGSIKDVVAIARAPCTTQAVEKLKCDKCNANPGGFRGPHELQRHKDRAHAPLRKAWVCVDMSQDKMFLASCKACRNDKKYGAYYNAAAHLRRTHFNKKPKGRKGKSKTEEKTRGGVSGGDEPPMEVLKLWMKEVDEFVPENMTYEDMTYDDLDSLQAWDISPTTPLHEPINHSQPIATLPTDCAADLSSAHISSTQTQPLISNLRDYTIAPVVQSHQHFTTDATHLLSFPINSEFSDLSSDPLMFEFEMPSDNAQSISAFDASSYSRDQIDPCRY